MKKVRILAVAISFLGLGVLYSCGDSANATDDTKDSIVEEVVNEEVVNEEIVVASTDSTVVDSAVTEETDTTAAVTE